MAQRQIAGDIHLIIGVGEYVRTLREASRAFIADDQCAVGVAPVAACNKVDVGLGGVAGNGVSTIA